MNDQQSRPDTLPVVTEKPRVNQAPMPTWVRTVDRLSSVLAIAAGLATVFMLVHVAVDVMARTFFNSPLPGTLEFITFVWMPTLVFLAMAFAERKGEHIRVSIIIERLHGKPATAFAIAITVLAAASIGILVFYGVGSALDAVRIQQSAVGTLVVPIWPAKIAMVVGLVGFLLQAVASLYRAFRPDGVAIAESLQAAIGAPPNTRGSRAFSASALVMAVVSAGLTLAILTVSGSRELTGMLVIALMLSLMLLGLHISLAMVVASVLGLYKLAGAVALAGSMKELVFSSSANWSLSVIPAFVIMGIALWKSGLTAKAYEAAINWLGRLPGGLAVGTNFAGAGLAAASGSSIGIAYALGRIAIPEMLKLNYRPSLATGVVAVAGTLGQLIPPSILLVVYAGVAQTAVGPQLLAAIVPGILLATGYGVMIVIRSVLSPTLAPKAELTGITWRVKWASLIGLIPILIVIVMVIGGIFGGFMTPTEAGAFGAIAAIAMGWISLSRRSRKPGTVRRFLSATLVETVGSVASIFALLIGVYVLTRVMTLSRVTNSLAEWIVSLELTVVPFLLILIALYLVLGMFLDPLAMILLTIPVLSAPLAAFGIDMIWFGVFVVVLSEIAQASPPVGLLSFVTYRLVQDPQVNLGHKISLQQVFGGVMWFIVVALLMLFALIAFPELATWLPSISTAS